MIVADGKLRPAPTSAGGDPVPTRSAGGRGGRHPSLGPGRYRNTRTGRLDTVRPASAGRSTRSVGGSTAAANPLLASAPPAAPPVRTPTGGDTGLAPAAFSDAPSHSLAEPPAPEDRGQAERSGQDPRPESGASAVTVEPSASSGIANATPTAANKDVQNEIAKRGRMALNRVAEAIFGGRSAAKYGPIAEAIKANPQRYLSPGFVVRGVPAKNGYVVVYEPAQSTGRHNWLPGANPPDGVTTYDPAEFTGETSHRPGWPSYNPSAGGVGSGQQDYPYGPASGWVSGAGDPPGGDGTPLMGAQEGPVDQ